VRIRQADTALPASTLDTLNCDFFLPNAFSPNGDGVNDVFKIHVAGDFTAKVHLFQVYDRWGELLYEVRNADVHRVGWDGRFQGKAAPPGVYVYRMAVESKEGPITLYGTLTLIR